MFLVLLLVGIYSYGQTADNRSNKEAISILSWNIKMLPRGATFLHHHPVIRARIIPEVLLKESADVIVFQEAFDGKAMRIIKKGLKEMYPYSQGYQNKKVITYKRAGGVLMFSKYPIKEVESIKYAQQKGIDKAAAKGALLAEVQHPAITFQLLGTHMQAGGSRELKISQYQEAGELLSRHLATGVPQFASGDFNTKLADTVLYPQLINALQMENGAISSELQFTSDHLLNDMDSYDPNRRNLIDFVFCKPNGVSFKNTTRTVLQYEQQWNKTHRDLSDHFAILLKTQVERQ